MTGTEVKGCAALGLYLDGELDVVASLAFEAHAESCDACRRDLTAFGALREQLRRDLTRHTADDGLRTRIIADVEAAAGAPTVQAKVPRAGRRSTPSHWLSLAAATLVVAVLSSGATLYLDRPGPEGRWLAGIVGAHERAMLSGHVFDIASSNRHVVKPWFSGKTTLAPPVVDLEDAGFALLGGRLDVPLREPIPALVYRAGPHVISVFVHPAAGDTRPHLEKRDGFSVLSWAQAGLAFDAVSDADSHEIERFQKAFAAKLDSVR
jgi:anti-sigma factor RsiW